MNDDMLALFGSWVQAIGTTLSAISSTEELNLSDDLSFDLDLLGNVMQGTGNALIADSEPSLTLDKIGNEIQSIGNSTIVAEMLLDLNETTKDTLNVKGNLLQAVGGTVSLGDALEKAPSNAELYNIYGNLLQIIGNSMQAISGIRELQGLEGQKMNEAGSWIQAIGSIISAIGQSKG